MKVNAKELKKWKGNTVIYSCFEVRDAIISNNYPQKAKYL
jgi:hypothetical protein